MSFISTNEVNKFCFDDCVITEFSRDKKGIKMSLDALIVCANNSQNSNYTDSYAGPTVCSLKNIEIVGVLKEGYNRYDANDNLIEEVLDEPIAPDDYPALFKSFEGAYLPRFEYEDGEYVLEVEMVDENDGVSDAYELHIIAENVYFTWENYMNRVQR